MSLGFTFYKGPNKLPGLLKVSRIFQKLCAVL